MIWKNAILKSLIDKWLQAESYHLQSLCMFTLPIIRNTAENIVCDTAVEEAKVLTWFFWVWTAASDRF